MRNVLLLLLLGWAGAAAAAPVWVEGEDPAAQRRVTLHNWYDAVRKDGMSGGAWLSHYDPSRAGTVTYRFQAAAGEYVFWWRGNTLLAKVAWALNGAPEQELDFADRRGEFMISPKPDHRSLAWVKVGRVRLTAGENRITFRFHSDIANHGGLDCFCFDDSGWAPAGTMKPAALAPAAAPAGPADWFPAAAGDDPFSPDSAIDMSRLVEAPAGRHGVLRAEGAGLRFADAPAPVRFWGCGANVLAGRFSPERQALRAKYLRKHGVNLVRVHPVFDELGPLRPDGTFDPARLAALDAWFAALKKEGIYSDWSLFYPLRIGPGSGYPSELFAELAPAGNGGLRSTSGLVNFSRALQDMQAAYARALLAHRNPFTGLRYADDPALAVLEIQNEDCVFFHDPLNELRTGKKWPLHSRALRRDWCAWALARYRTADALKAAWGKFMPGDRPEAGELELMGAYHFGGAGPVYEFAGQTRRAGDFIRFLAERQRDFYERRVRELRNAGFQGVVITTAWKAGGPAADPANLWCDTAGSLVDRHNYFGGGAGGHGIAAGAVNNGSHLTHPGGGLLAIGLYQVADRPFGVTEWTQLPPNPWKAEAAPLIAFYGMGLQGWDLSCHFLNSHDGLGDGWPELSSYSTDTPHYIGQFPALAFAIYRGHVREAPVVAARRVDDAALFSGRDPLGQDLAGDGDAKDAASATRTPRELLAAGRITVAFADSGKGAGGSVDPAPLWDRERRIVRAATGELEWDYGRGLVQVRTPKTQALIGRAMDGDWRLPGVRVRQVATPFISLIFTPLDDLPLAESRCILVTAMARDRQAGAEYNADASRLLQVGGPPLLLEPVQATVRLEGVPPRSVRPLDLHGDPARGGAVVPLDPDGSFRLDGRWQACYYEVRR